MKPFARRIEGDSKRGALIWLGLTLLMLISLQNSLNLSKKIEDISS